MTRVRARACPCCGNRSTAPAAALPKLSVKVKLPSAPAPAGHKRFPRVEGVPVPGRDSPVAIVFKLAVPVGHERDLAPAGGARGARGSGAGRKRARDEDAEDYKGEEVVFLPCCLLYPCTCMKMLCMSAAHTHTHAGGRVGRRREQRKRRRRRPPDQTQKRHRAHGANKGHARAQGPGRAGSKSRRGAGDCG